MPPTVTVLLFFVLLTIINTTLISSAPTKISWPQSDFTDAVTTDGGISYSLTLSNTICEQLRLQLNPGETHLNIAVALERIIPFLPAQTRSFTFIMENCVNINELGFTKQSGQSTYPSLVHELSFIFRNNVFGSETPKPQDEAFDEFHRSNLNIYGDVLFGQTLRNSNPGGVDIAQTSTIPPDSKLSFHIHDNTFWYLFNHSFVISDINMTGRNVDFDLTFERNSARGVYDQTTGAPADAWMIEQFAFHFHRLAFDHPDTVLNLSDNSCDYSEITEEPRGFGCITASLINAFEAKLVSVNYNSMILYVAGEVSAGVKFEIPILKNVPYMQLDGNNEIIVGPEGTSWAQMALQLNALTVAEEEGERKGVYVNWDNVSTISCDHNWILVQKRNEGTAAAEFFTIRYLNDNNEEFFNPHVHYVRNIGEIRMNNNSAHIVERGSTITAVEYMMRVPMYNISVLRANNNFVTARSFARTHPVTFKAEVGFFFIDLYEFKGNHLHNTMEYFPNDSPLFFSDGEVNGRTWIVQIKFEPARFQLPILEAIGEFPPIFINRTLANGTVQTNVRLTRAGDFNRMRLVIEDNYANHTEANRCYISWFEYYNTLCPLTEMVVRNNSINAINKFISKDFLLPVGDNKGERDSSEEVGSSGMYFGFRPVFSYVGNVSIYNNSMTYAFEYEPLAGLASIQLPDGVKCFEFVILKSMNLVGLINISNNDCHIRRWGVVGTATGSVAAVSFVLSNENVCDDGDCNTDFGKFIIVDSSSVPTISNPNFTKLVGFNPFGADFLFTNNTILIENVQQCPTMGCVPVSFSANTDFSIVNSIRVINNVATIRNIQNDPQHVIANPKAYGAVTFMVMSNVNFLPTAGSINIGFEIFFNASSISILMQDFILSQNKFLVERVKLSRSLAALSILPGRYMYFQKGVVMMENDFQFPKERSGSDKQAEFVPNPEAVRRSLIRLSLPETSGRLPHYLGVTGPAASLPFLFKGLDGGLRSDYEQVDEGFGQVAHLLHWNFPGEKKIKLTADRSMNGMILDDIVSTVDQQIEMRDGFEMLVADDSEHVATSFGNANSAVKLFSVSSLGFAIPHVTFTGGGSFLFYVTDSLMKIPRNSFNVSSFSFSVLGNTKLRLVSSSSSLPSVFDYDGTLFQLPAASILTNDQIVDDRIALEYMNITLEQAVVTLDSTSSQSFLPEFSSAPFANLPPRNTFVTFSNQTNITITSTVRQSLISFRDYSSTTGTNDNNDNLPYPPTPLLPRLASIITVNDTTILYPNAGANEQRLFATTVSSSSNNLIIYSKCATWNGKLLRQFGTDFAGPIKEQELRYERCLAKMTPTGSRTESVSEIPICAPFTLVSSLGNTLLPHASMGVSVKEFMHYRRMSVLVSLLFEDEKPTPSPLSESGYINDDAEHFDFVGTAQRQSFTVFRENLEFAWPRTGSLLTSASTSSFSSGEETAEKSQAKMKAARNLSSASFVYSETPSIAVVERAYAVSTGGLRVDLVFPSSRLSENLEEATSVFEPLNERQDYKIVLVVGGETLACEPETVTSAQIKAKNLDYDQQQQQQQQASSTPTLHSVMEHRVKIKLRSKTQLPNIPSSLLATFSIIDNIALVTTATIGPTGSLMAKTRARYSLLSRYSDCIFNSEEPLGFELSPLDMQIGTDTGRYLRGAIIGNGLVFLIFLGTLSVFAGFHVAYRLWLQSKKRSGKVRTKGKKDKSPFKQFFDAMMSLGMMPVLLFCQTALFQGAVFASVILFFYGPKKSSGLRAFDQLIAALCVLICFAFGVWMIYGVRVKLPSFPSIQFVPREFLLPESDDDSASDSPDDEDVLPHLLHVPSKSCEKCAQSRLRWRRQKYHQEEQEEEEDRRKRRLRENNHDKKKSSGSILPKYRPLSVRFSFLKELRMFLREKCGPVFKHAGEWQMIKLRKQQHNEDNRVDSSRMLKKFLKRKNMKNTTSTRKSSSSIVARLKAETKRDRRRAKHWFDNYLDIVNDVRDNAPWYLAFDYALCFVMTCMEGYQPNPQSVECDIMGAILAVMNVIPLALAISFYPVMRHWGSNVYLMVSCVIVTIKSLMILVQILYGGSGIDSVSMELAMEACDLVFVFVDTIQLVYDVVTLFVESPKIVVYFLRRVKHVVFHVDWKRVLESGCHFLTSSCGKRGYSEEDPQQEEKDANRKQRGNASKLSSSNEAELQEMRPTIDDDDNDQDNEQQELLLAFEKRSGIPTAASDVDERFQQRFSRSDTEVHSSSPPNQNHRSSSNLSSSTTATNRRRTNKNRRARSSNPQCWDL